MSIYSYAPWRRLGVAALAVCLLWLLPASSIAADTARARLASSAIATLVARDADALASRLRHDWQRGSTTGTIVKTTYGCCDVYDLARPGHYAHGVYILQSVQDGSRLASFRLIEMATHKGYRPGDAGMDLYRFSLEAIGKGNWLVEPEYFNHADSPYITGKVLPHQADGELTASELQTLYEQVLSVFGKAEHHAPVSEETFLAQAVSQPSKP